MVNYVYQLGFGNKSISLPSYTISPNKYKVTSVTTQQDSGVPIKNTQYYLNTNTLTFSIWVDNQKYENSTAVFNITATLDDPFNT